MLLNIIYYILYNQEKGYFRKNYDKKNKTIVHSYLYLMVVLICLIETSKKFYMMKAVNSEVLNKFRGIKSQGEEAYGKILITEPS